MEFPYNEYEPLNLYTNFYEAAQKFPETNVFFDEPLKAFPEIERESTYQKCLIAIQNRASQLQQIGIKKADKVIIYKSANFESYFLAVAVSAIGGVPAMISYHLPVETMDILADRLEQPWLIYDFETQEKAHQIKNLPVDKLLDCQQIATIPVKKKMEQQKLALDEISYMTHTSGTTGVPKLIAHSANSMGWRIKWQRNIFDLIKPKNLVAFHISPVHSRFNIGISSLMSKGFPLLNIANPAKDNVTNVMKKYQPYAVETHPNNFVQWASLARSNPEVFSSIKYFHSTFDAINGQTMAAFLEASSYEDAVFMQVYGQSECGPMIMRFHTKESIQTIEARNMGVGMPELTEVRIVDEVGNPVKPNTQGNIQMLSKGRALTYFKEDERFQSNVYDKWWDSGDYGLKDEAGDLYLLDRQVDLIDQVTSTLAIEDALLDQLTFLDEVVIVRDKEGSPQPIIALSENAEMNWDAWWKSVHNMPFLNEPILMEYNEIPRTATMKVQRLAMEKTFKEQA